VVWAQVDEGRLIIKVDLSSDHVVLRTVNHRDFSQSWQDTGEVTIRRV
jgi:hypothetical protein